MVVEKKYEPIDFVLFGTLGDLSRRKLLPSLYQLDKANLLHQGTKVTGIARQTLNNAKFVKTVRENILEFMSEEICEQTWKRFSKRLEFASIDMTDSADYKKLKNLVDPERVMVCYFATPPSLFGDICKGMDGAGIIDKTVRVVLEKPIGHDFKSSEVINNQVAEYFEEKQIYRIDHYLGKETVLNLIALRFANSIFATNWDNNCIDHVQISVSESVGIEGRWGYFDGAGQMRDMVQNHLLQILSLIAMEPPTTLDADSIRDEKLKVLKALRTIDVSNVNLKTVRGQYGSGFVAGKEVPGYLEEPDANEKSTTETFVAIKAEIDNWRWAGVPFYLRTGKRLPAKVSEIVIYFKRQPHNLFRDSFANLPANKLVIRLQPEEGVEVTVMNKVPGLTSSGSMDLQKSKLDLSFSEEFGDRRIADAYEKLLLEVMIGNQALFVRRDEVEQAWTWVDSIMSAWNKNNEPPEPYQAGTWGPVSSIALLAREERNWYESKIKKKVGVSMALVFHEFDTASDLNTSFAKEILSALSDAITQKGKASLVVSGGSTPKALFSALSKTPFSWDKVCVTLADERWVSREHKDSNEKLVRENLLQNEAAAATFVSLTNTEANAQNAEVEISARIDAIDETFDVLILGMGEDGHTASLFPCCEQIHEGLNLSRGLSAIATSPTTAPYQRMSMSLAKIISAKKVFLHLIGNKKKAVLDDALANFTELEKPIKAVCDNTTVNLMWAP